MNEPATTGLTVSQMAAATGVSSHTLRYYERVGLIELVARNDGNQRRYSEADIEWLKFSAVYCGFPRALNATFMAKKVFAERGLLPLA